MNAAQIAAELVVEIKGLLGVERALEKVEVTIRELNQVASQTLSLFSEYLLSHHAVPLCPKCEQEMKPKEDAAPTLRTTFGKIENHATDYSCKKCKKGQRVHAYDVSPKARMSPLFSSMLTLFGATWPEEVAAACTLTTFGQKVSPSTIHNLLKKEPPSVQTTPVIFPESTTVCTDGILVNGRQKKEKIEAKVVSIYSCTKTEGSKENPKVKVKDAQFLASGVKPWPDMSGPVLQALQERGVTDTSKVLCVGDGAAGLWSMLKYGVPGGIEQLDGYHLKKKVSERCKEQFDKKEGREVSQKMNKHLDVGEVDFAIETLMNAWATKEPRSGAEDVNKAADKLVAYLRRHQKRAENWAKNKKSSRNKGSGLQEKANDMVIGARCKDGEMHWGRPGLDHMAQHRCAILNQTYQALASFSG